MATDAELRRAPDPRLHLELGLLRLVNAKRLAPLEEVLAELREGGAGSKPSGAPSGGGLAKQTLRASAGGPAPAPATTHAVGSSGAAAKMAPAPAFQMPPKLSNASSSALPKLVIEPRSSVPSPAAMVVPVEARPRVRGPNLIRRPRFRSQPRPLRLRRWRCRWLPAIRRKFWTRRGSNRFDRC